MRKLFKKMGGAIVLLLIFIMMLGTVVLAAETTDTENDTTLETDVNLENGNYEIRWTADKTSYTYTGVAIKPEIAVYDVTDADAPKMLEPQYYTVSYVNNTNAGKAKVIVTGTAGYTGTLEKEFTIARKSIKGLSLAVSKTCYYTGKTVKPSVVLKDGTKTLKLNTDYTIACSNAVQIGTAKVTITGIGNYSGSLAQTYNIRLGKVEISEIYAVTYNKIKLSWNKVTGASGYKIYRSTSADGKMVLCKTITSGSTLSYTDTGLTNGRRYYYKVIAYRTVNGARQYSYYSQIKSERTHVAQPKITGVKSKTYSSINVTWDKVPYADGYRIYRSTSENTGFLSIGTTKGVSFTDTGRLTGTTYYYRVRAYRYSGKTGYYGYPSVSAGGKAALGRVTITSKPAISSKANLTWGKVTGAHGYEIYRSEAEAGKYVRVKTITSGSTLKWTNAGLANKTYYYKIRAYRTVNGKNVYGSFSSVYTKYRYGWKYVNGYKLYYDNNGKLVKDVSGIIGKQSSYYLKVNRKTCTVNVFAKDGNKGYILPVKTFTCSVGLPATPTPTGTFYTMAKYRWHTLMGPSYGQYCTRIVGGVLFHSVAGRNMTSYNLNARDYNNLGSPASHGCVRLTVRDAKWIYDNCSLKTKVTIYDSTYPGPFGKPATIKIPANQTWDPTDPAIKK